MQRKTTLSIDIARDDARFQRNFSRMLIGFAIFTFFYLTTLTYTILKTTPVYMHDWRGITCILLMILAFSLYIFPILASLGILPFDWGWPPPLSYTVLIWGSFYLVVFLLTRIDQSFFLSLYILFGLSFSLFTSRRLFLAIGIMALTIFTYEGLLTWPLKQIALFSITSQCLTFFSITGFSILIQNLITERFERNHLFQQLQLANTDLEEAHRQLAQSVEQEQELAILRERTRLAREMHDTLGHALVLITVKLEAAQRLRERDPERCDQELESTKEITRESMSALRASIANLRTPALQHKGIKQALIHSLDELRQRAGLDVSHTLQGELDSLADPLKETLWKVSQEAFANIEKHAHAQHVTLSLRQEEGNLILIIQDDGIGLPTAYCQHQEDGSLACHSPEGHYGLRGMLERVESVGGRLSLRSGEKQGTTIEVTLPL